MDRPLVLDTRIMDLAPMYIGKPRYALALAQGQALTYARTGHVLAFNDEYVWRRLKSEMREDGQLPAVRVRCMRCWAVAGLHDWVNSCDLAEKQRDALKLVLLEAIPTANLRWLDPCDGQKQATAVLEALRSLCGDE
jgi:hypothetical protein